MKQTIIKEETTDPANTPDGMAVRLGHVENELKGFRMETRDALREITSGLANLATTTYVDREIAEVRADAKALFKINADKITKLENINGRVAWIIVGTVLLGVLSAVGLKVYGL